MSDLINVKNFRKERGLTQTQLADRCGVSTRTVQNWEKGGTIPEVAKKLIAQIGGKHATVSPIEITPRSSSVGAESPIVRVVVPSIDHKIVLPKRNALNALKYAKRGKPKLVTPNTDGTITIESVEETTTPIPIAPIQANIDTGQLSPNENTEPITAENAEVIELIRKEIREEVIEEIREEVKEEIKQESAVTVIPVEVASQVDVDIKKYIEENESELKKLSPSDLTGDVDGLEEVRKNSMWPTFVPGDKVFIKFLKHKCHIVDGGFYYFNLKDRPTMIRQVKIEGNNLRLIALNPQFRDIVTNIDNVLRVADVKGMYREFISDQYSEVEAVRRKKEEQIDKLIDQNQEALKIIGGLLKK